MSKLAPVGRLSVAPGYNCSLSTSATEVRLQGVFFAMVAVTSTVACLCVSIQALHVG